MLGNYNALLSEVGEDLVPLLGKPEDRGTGNEHL
jgi:hypothetical protein